MLEPLKIQPDHIILSNYKLNKTGFIITQILMFTFVLLPFVMLVSILKMGNSPAFGFLIFTCICGLSVYFFYRLSTWNKYGTENFIRSGENLIYHPKDKNISFQIRELDLKSTSVSMISVEESVIFNQIQEGLFRLKFDFDGNSFETSIKTPNSVLLLIIRDLEKWGVKSDEALHEIR